jgi:hypothetical protein
VLDAYRHLAGIDDGNAGTGYVAATHPRPTTSAPLTPAPDWSSSNSRPTVS